MFVVAEEATYEWPVDVYWPSATKPGTYDVQRFWLTFTVVPSDEAKAIQAELRDGDGDGDDALLISAARGWRDVVTADKQLIPYSAAAFERLLRLAPVRLACYRAYTASLSGGLAAPRRGN